MPGAPPCPSGTMLWADFCQVPPAMACRIQNIHVSKTTPHQRQHNVCRVLVAAAAGLDGEAAVLAAARLALLQGITAYQALVHVSHRRLALQLKVHDLQYKASTNSHCSIALCVCPTYNADRPICMQTNIDAYTLTTPVANCQTFAFTPRKLRACRSATCPFLQPGPPLARRPKAHERQARGDWVLSTE